jgi:hypothetical protein
VNKGKKKKGRGCFLSPGPARKVVSSTSPDNTLSAYHLLPSEYQPPLHQRGSRTAEKGQLRVRPEFTSTRAGRSLEHVNAEGSA